MRVACGDDAVGPQHVGNRLRRVGSLHSMAVTDSRVTHDWLSPVRRSRFITRYDDALTNGNAEHENGSIHVEDVGRYHIEVVYGFGAAIKPLAYNLLRGTDEALDVEVAGLVGLN